MAGNNTKEVECDGVTYIVDAEDAPSSAPATEPTPGPERLVDDDPLAGAALLPPGQIIEVPTPAKAQGPAAPAPSPSSRASPSTPAPKSRPARSTRPASTVPPQSEIKLPIRGGGLVDKWRLLELVEALTKEGILKPSDMGLVFYVANNSSRDTQVCRRQLRTIAEDLRRARSMVIESIARLVKAGLLLRHQRRVRGGWKVSSDLALNYAALEKRKPHDDRSAGHPMTAPPVIQAASHDDRRAGLSDDRPAGRNVSHSSKNLPIKRGRPPDRSSEPPPMAPEDRATPEQWQQLRKIMKKNGMQGD